MDVEAELDALEADLATLSPTAVEGLVASYPRWAPVMASALDAVPPAAMQAMRPLTGRVRHLVTERLGEDADLLAVERVTMAMWLYLVSRLATDSRTLASLLGEPWLEVVAAR